MEAEKKPGTTISRLYLAQTSTFFFPDLTEPGVFEHLSAPA